MKKSKKTVVLLSLVLMGTFLFSACSKDSKDTPDPTLELKEGAVSATIEFLESEKLIEFTGTAMGAIGTGSQDTVVMVFSAKSSAMSFWLMITPANKGDHIMGESNFKCAGIFYQDSLRKNVKEVYLVGADNIDDNDTEMDGAASFHISALTRDRIKGSFGLTMILNSTVYENGELLSGEIKTIKVTNGKFDCPLFDGSISERE